MIIWLMHAAAFMGQAEAPRLPPKVEERLKASVVSIQNHSKAGQGNGVIVDQFGSALYILTAAHIFDPTDRLSVKVFPSDFPQGEVIRQVKVNARLDPNNGDLALLRIESAFPLKVERIAVLDPKALPTEKTFAAFSLSCTPVGAQMTSARARPESVVSAPKKSAALRAPHLWKVKNVAEVGRSGGPLVDAEGRLLGICSGNDGEAGFFAHLNDVREFLKSKSVQFTTDSKKAGD
jgi:S1-C subfamily serine protease